LTWLNMVPPEMSQADLRHLVLDMKVGARTLCRTGALTRVLYMG
jgi:hypothetical protein